MSCVPGNLQPQPIHQEEETMPSWYLQHALNGAMAACGDEPTRRLIQASPKMYDALAEVNIAPWAKNVRQAIISAHNDESASTESPAMACCGSRTKQHLAHCPVSRRSV
jgi:hypothetical protein